MSRDLKETLIQYGMTANHIPCIRLSGRAGKAGVRVENGRRREYRRLRAEVVEILIPVPTGLWIRFSDPNQKTSFR